MEHTLVFTFYNAFGNVVYIENHATEHFSTEKENYLEEMTQIIDKHMSAQESIKSCVISYGWYVKRPKDK